MEKLGKILSRYLLMSVMALMLVCFSVTTAFATEGTGEEIPGELEATKTAEMLAKLDHVSLVAENTVYSGEEAEPSVKLMYTDEELNVQDQDVTAEYVFSISCEDKNSTIVSGKKATVTATITGYYLKDSETVNFAEAKQLTAEFEIAQADISAAADLTLSKTEFTYNGKEQKPDITVSKKSTVLVNESDYDIAVTDDRINAGTKTVTVTGKGNFKGKLEKTYKIKQADFSNLEMSAKLTSVTYIADGSEKKPAVSGISAKLGGSIRNLTSGEYSVQSVNYVNNTNAGTARAEISVTGRGTNFTGSKKISVNFTISTAEISVGNVTYNGKVQTPTVTVKVNNKTLSVNTDYVVTCQDKNAGTATAVITFKGNYSGTIKKTFEISPRKITSLSLSSSSYTYNGKVQKPDLTVNADSLKLSASGDYTVAITDSKGNKDSSINAGTKTVTVTGKGNYTGTLTKTYTINAKSLSSASVTLAKTTYSYNGKTQKPGTTVKIKLASGTVTLTKDKDYTVSYSTDCKNIGKKTVTIKGKGNYSGTVKKTYKIVPEKASGLKVSSRGTSSLKLTCTKAKSKDCSYQFIIKKYDSKAKKWVQVSSKKTTSNSYTFKKLDAGRVYACYVRIYKKVGSDTFYGSWSSAMKTPTAPSKPVMSYAVKTGSKSMKAVWKAVSSATGYEIQYSTKSDFSSNVKTITVKGRTTTSKTISGLKSSGTYYVRVRAYYTYNKKTYRGSWSSKVSTYYSNVYASYTTYYNSGNKNRSTNLRLACNAINGKILANGDTFSFNGIVGVRTAAKGYKEAIIYEGGQEVGGIGGGICQVATTLFNAALKANFTIVERHQHSMTVHYAPLGYDAAIAWGSKNLRFRNNSGTSVKVDIHASGGTLSVKFLTNTYKKPPAVSTKVTVRNGVYTLKRSVNGKVNYTTTSDYLDN